MDEEHDPATSTLARATELPLPAELRRRTLAIARTNLAPAAVRRRPPVFAEYAPPLSLVPGLLISAGAVFVVDAFIKVVRLFCIS